MLLRQATLLGDHPIAERIVAQLLRWLPLLVLQGDNDPRVPKEEAQQVVDILKKEGRVVDVHYYPNEGHGFVKRENQIDSIRRTIAWFDRYLMGYLMGKSLAP